MQFVLDIHQGIIVEELTEITFQSRKKSMKHPLLELTLNKLSSDTNNIDKLTG